MSSDTPNNRIKKMIALIGLNPDEYGSHSCRRGGATGAAKAEIETRLLMRHGRWKSLAVHRYIDETMENRLKVGDAMFSGATENAASTE